MRAHAPQLTDRQMRLVQAAAKSLPPHLRDAFLSYIADRLVGSPTNIAVQAVVNIALDHAMAFACAPSQRLRDG